MKIDQNLINDLLREAKTSPRLRVAKDLRNTPQDLSQRMLNAMLPDTQVPIHRHTTTSETVIILHGSMEEIYFDEEGRETSRTLLSANGPVRGINIPKGQWHTVNVTEPCVIMEIKDGPYAPAKPEDLR